MTQITKEAIEAAWAAYQKFGWSTQEGMQKALEAALPFLSTLPIAGEGRWLPIAQADRTITDVQDFSEVGITLRNSDRYWVRDTDGRVYEASWTDDKDGYWWDWEAESPVDPIEFMPHPLDPRFSALVSSPGKEGGQEVEALPTGFFDDQFEKPSPSDDAVKSAAREAGWALSTLVDEIRFEKRQQVVNIINRLSAALYASSRQQPSSAALIALREIAAEQNVYLGHGNYDTIPALTAEESQSVARSALASPQPASTALVERLTSALAKLEREASEVSKIGAKPGAQWTRLAGALINARSALSASHSTSREGESR